MLSVNLEEYCTNQMKIKVRTVYHICCLNYSVILDKIFLTVLLSLLFSELALGTYLAIHAYYTENCLVL